MLVVYMEFKWLYGWCWGPINTIPTSWYDVQELRYKSYKLEQHLQAWKWSKYPKSSSMCSNSHTLSDLQVSTCIEQHCGVCLWSLSLGSKLPLSKVVKRARSSKLWRALQRLYLTIERSEREFKFNPCDHLSEERVEKDRSLVGSSIEM